MKSTILLRLQIWATALTAGAASLASAGVTYDESVSGDLSDDRLAPSTLLLGSGLNTLTGTFGISLTSDMPDLDYVTITVPVGYVLDGFTVLAANVGGAFSFVGIQAGSVVTIPYDWTSVNSPLLGWAHFGTASVGSDILGELGAAPGAGGFQGPLGAGNYTLWIMELDTSRAYSYAFGLHLAQVPAPGVLALVALAAGLAVPRRRPRETKRSGLRVQGSAVALTPR